MATVLPSTAISPCVACQIRNVIDLPLFCGKPSRVVIDPAPSLLPSPLELAKHGDCPSKTDATIDDNFADRGIASGFGFLRPSK
jgi:hypothetical protein